MVERTKRKVQSYSDVKIYYKLKYICTNTGIDKQMNKRDQGLEDIDVNIYENLVYGKDSIQNNEKRMNDSLVNVGSTGYLGKNNKAEYTATT